MRIDNVGKIKNIPDKQVINANEYNTVKKDKNIPRAAYEKPEVEDKGHIYDKSTIDDLKKISERSTLHLKKLIEDMIAKQGKAVSLLNPNSMIKIDEATRAEANELISADGPLGVEALSDSIVDFAKAISGGDTTKLDTLKAAIEKGFKAAEKVLGSLPEISQKTYNRIMEKLDKWENE